MLLIPITSTGGFVPGEFRCQPTAVLIVSRPLKDLTAILPQDTVACLQLSDNGRRIPFRALTPGLFLIGSGPSCDLRLGESGVPSLHSMIRVDETGAQIALLCAGPPLFVRGLQVPCADLADGDVLEIGGFRAVYRSVLPIVAAIHEPVAHEPVAEESQEQMLRLPEAAQVQHSPGGDLSETIEKLSSRLADQLRMLVELQENQRLLSQSMQQVSEQLKAFRKDHESRPPRRASA